MRSVTTWSDRVPDKDGIKSAVNDMVFNPDGTQLVVAVGKRVVVYDAVDGDLIGCDNVRSKWEGQRDAKEKDSICLLLDIEVGTLDVYLNGSRLGRMACGLQGVGPFRFVAEIFTEAKVRIVSKPPPPPHVPTPPTSV